MWYRSQRVGQGRRLPAPVFFVAILTLISISTAAAPTATSGFVLRERGLLQPGKASWVAEGDGVLAYGAGRTAWFVLQASGRSSSIALEEPVSDCALVSRFAYLGQPGEGLRVVDVRDPSAPVDLGLIPMNGESFHVATWGDSVLVAADGIGLWVMALPADGACALHHASSCLQPGDALRLQERGFLPLARKVTALTSDGFRAYVALRGGTLVAVDLSDASRPSELWRAPLGPDAGGLTVSGGTLLASGPDAIRAWSLSPAGLGVPLASLAIRADGLLLEGRTLYAAGPSGVAEVEAGPTTETTVNVNVANFSFTPSTVNINPGDTVQWTWVSGTHSSTSGSCSGGNCTPDGVWDSGAKSSGTFSRTFTSPGDFPYYCTVHLSSMTGKVKVAAPASLTASSSASVSAGAAPLTVDFTGTAAGGTAPYTYGWAFGDGATSADQNPSHTYASIGVYTATLTVHDSASASAEAAPLTITVTTVQPPVVTSIRKAGNPFRIIVEGSNLEDGIAVAIDGNPWSNVVWKKSTKIVLKGGSALKAVVPKNTSVQMVFTNPDGGSVSTTFQWP